MKKLLLTLACATASLVYGASTPERAAVARKAAAESIVLLKNDGALPLAADAKVDVVDQVGVKYMGCGRGSAWVYMPNCRTIEEGLTAAGYELSHENRDVAVFTITRNATEGVETENFNEYYLNDAERAKIAELAAQGYKKIVLVLNVGTMISMEELKTNPAISAILYVSYPGMEGGNAIADVMTGKVNPSGRLPVTVAKTLEDYPSNATWQEARHYVPYEEDIFVGYRYFSTIPGANKAVTYPFGYGLSYTEFRLANASAALDGETVRVSVDVTNVGKLAGRHSVLAYTGVVGGAADHPARELRMFAKTKKLAPGETETLDLSFPVAQLAYFDDEGASGSIGSWVVDEGVYTIYLGGAVDEAASVGSITLGASVLSTPGFKLCSDRLAKRLRSNGSSLTIPVHYGDKNGRRFKTAAWPKARPDAEHLIKLQAVARGEKTLDEFVDQMPLEDLLKLLVGQPNILPVGNTRSIGTLEEYGVTGLQTADGPVGIRLGQKPKKGAAPIPEQLSTAFPATALTAGSFDIELQEEYGRVLGEEAVAVGIDIHLAPGICIARHPMCGRNFEYMGEDPYLAGRMSAAYIRGVQTQGVASTIKHFAGNNRENSRRESMDVVSERALREIYLKGFEIAVKESHPKCVMTAYNGINGRWSGANYGMIEGILRGEWGFDGVVMTDWHARSQLWQNIASGNDVKMPDDFYGSEIGGGAEQLKKMALQDRLSPARIKESAKRVLRFVMDSPRFKATL